MTTDHEPARTARRGRMFFFVIVAFVLLVATSEAAAAEDDVKDHAIFIGARLVIAGDDVSGPIRDVAANFAIVGSGDNARKVSLRELGSLSIEREPAISPVLATVAHQAGRRLHSPSRNPALKSAQQQILMSAIRADKMDQATMEIIRADTSGVGGPRTGPNDVVDTSAARSAAAADYAETLTEVAGDLYNPMMHDDGDAARAEDMYEVTFEVSAPAVIDDVYAAMITTVFVPDGRGRTATAVYMKKIGRISPDPRRITLADAGLPPGFAVQKCEVHLYSDGREIATNQSQHLVPVSRSEAFQFLLIQYLMNHKGQTAPAAPTPEMLSDDARRRLAGIAPQHTVQVRVSAAGAVETITPDPSLDTATADFVETVLRDACFYPALIAGEPATSTATFTLRELATPTP